MNTVIATAESEEVAAAAANDCYHCGLPLQGAQWSTEIDQVQRAMCCPGCQAAAQTIVEMGLTDYYRTRS
ncbi:heavy metal translocating P-type ATPase metal-binding domain-containing protein, partial [Herminiimonas sp.]|uniref:heavy metal translocating P-type ATPase metal-binding domain-containing protein n=1 Tax=Herminiimonas sp. TaxID=1926289 RepID=UPI00271B68EC